MLLLKHMLLKIYGLNYSIKAGCRIKGRILGLRLFPKKKENENEGDLQIKVSATHSIHHFSNYVNIFCMYVFVLLSVINAERIYLSAEQSIGCFFSANH